MNKENFEIGQILYTIDNIYQRHTFYKVVGHTRNKTPRLVKLNKIEKWINPENPITVMPDSKYFSTISFCPTWSFSRNNWVWKKQGLYKYDPKKKYTEY